MRPALQNHADGYLAALLAHDPDRLALSPDARFTENTVELSPGLGLWRTISGRGTYSLTVTDEAANQAVFFGTIEENGRAAIMVLRLKLARGRIAESETLVVRDPDAAARMGTPHEVFTQQVTAAQRTPRRQMLALTERYFDAIASSDAGDLQFDVRCTRRENGSQSTSNPTRTEDFESASFHGYALDCKEQFATRMWSFIERVHPRRYVAIDEQRGLLVGFFSFMHPGLPVSLTAPGGELVPMPPYARQPSTFEIAELFKFEAGRFRQIEAFGIMLPYGAHSGW